LKTLRVVAFLDSLSEAQAIAADVDINGEVSGADALSILRYLAFFPRNTAYTGNWSFWPYESSFVMSADTTVNVGAVVLGDVNLNWVSAVVGGGDSVSANKARPLAQIASSASAEVKLPTISMQSVPADNIIEIPITVSTDSMLGFAQVVVDYDGAVLEFIDARMGNSANGFSLQVNNNLPFNPTTQGANEIPAKSKGKALVTLKIYNTQGQLVRTLVDGEKSTGRYQVTWDGRNDLGAKVTSGTYFYTLTADGFTSTKKMIALK